jgi:hypothetical protein
MAALFSNRFKLPQGRLKCEFYRVLTMVHDTQNYCVLGLFPSSGILENRKDDVSENGSVSVLM